MKSARASLLPGTLAYGIGVAVGFFLILIAVWADMESNFYGFERLANAGLRGFRCPILMTPDETATISLDIANPTQARISPSVKTYISTRVLAQEFQQNAELDPGESQRLEWPVGPDNIDLGHFIFAKVLFFSAYPLPSREATCGIFIVDWPGSGQTIVLLLVLIGLLGMGWGLYNLHRLRFTHDWVKKYSGSLAFLALVVLLGLVVSFMGNWLLSLPILMVAVLVVIILLNSLLVSERRKRR